MDQEAKIVTGTKFFVITTGRTNGAHQDIVAKLNAVGHMDVWSPEGSDYILVFCPIVSRVGTDISEALENIPDDKPTILVVMHNTFNPDQVVAPSRRQVDNPNVYLTVDCLFYEGRLLQCNRNDTAWSDIRKSLGVPPSQVLPRNDISNWLSNKWKLAMVGVAVMVAVVIIVILSVTLTKK